MAKLTGRDFSDADEKRARIGAKALLMETARRLTRRFDGDINAVSDFMTLAIEAGSIRPGLKEILRGRPESRIRRFLVDELRIGRPAAVREQGVRAA